MVKSQTDPNLLLSEYLDESNFSWIRNHEPFLLGRAILLGNIDLKKKTSYLLRFLNSSNTQHSSQQMVLFPQFIITFEQRGISEIVDSCFIHIVFFTIYCVFLSLTRSLSQYQARTDALK